MSSNRIELSGHAKKTYPNISSHSTCTFSGHTKVTITGNIGSNSHFDISGHSNVNIESTVGESVTFSITGHAKVFFANRPSQSVIDSISSSGYCSISMPGGFNKKSSTNSNSTNQFVGNFFGNVSGRIINGDKVFGRVIMGDKVVSRSNDSDDENDAADEKSFSHSGSGNNFSHISGDLVFGDLIVGKSSRHSRSDSNHNSNSHIRGRIGNVSGGIGVAAAVGGDFQVSGGIGRAGFVGGNRSFTFTHNGIRTEVQTNKSEGIVTVTRNEEVTQYYGDDANAINNKVYIDNSLVTLDDPRTVRHDNNSNHSSSSSSSSSHAGASNRSSGPAQASNSSSSRAGNSDEKAAPKPDAKSSISKTQAQRLEEIEFKGEIPDEFCCPITLEIMESPVIASDGHTYEEKAIKDWLKIKKHSPVEGEGTKITNALIPNKAMKSQISQFVDKEVKKSADLKIKERDDKAANAPSNNSSALFADKSKKRKSDEEEGLSQDEEAEQLSKKIKT